jgi:hypothetical protein
MPSQDQKSNIKVENALSLATVTSTGTTTGEVIDTASYASLTFSVRGHGITNGTYTATILEGDATGSLAQASASAIIGTAVLTSADSNSSKTIGYVGDKRYAQLSIARSGTVSGILSADAIKGFPVSSPV